MRRLGPMVLLVAACMVAAPGRGTAARADVPSLAGAWTLNRALSQFPRDVGFGMDVIPADRSGSGGATGGGMGSGGVDPNAVSGKPQTEEESRNTQQLLGEIRTPPVRLTIAQTATDVTITDDRGRSRTFHADGRQDTVTLDAGPMGATARWDGARLIVRYRAGANREIRYTYSRKIDPPQLVVQAETLERGGHDTIVRVYDPAKPGDPVAPAEPAAPGRLVMPAPAALPVLPSMRDTGRPGAADPAGTGQGLVPVVPAASAGASDQMDQRPDAELKGLASLGVVVEDLGSQSVSCGLRQDAIDAAVAKSFADAGIKVVRDTDDDSYLYVRVTTLALSTGYCFSRYDAFVYTQTTATLSYGSRPVLVRVELLHEGGVAGSGVATHGDTVTKTLKQYADAFAARIRNANK
ncbi:MAG: hypothetical protein NTY02_00980 [Acidobacteria bacterium]|nr:hypothetical protein [Acidobacteriota bacterium]